VALPSPLIAVPNVTAHPSMTSVPTSYYSMWHQCTLKGYKTKCYATYLKVASHGAVRKDIKSSRPMQARSQTKTHGRQADF